MTKVEWNDDELRDLAASPAVHKQVKQAANRIARKARSIAPRRSGNYRDGIVVRDAEPDPNQGSDGTVVVAATTIAAHIIEYGGIRNTAYAPLRRAAQEVAGDAYRQIDQYDE